MTEDDEAPGWDAIERALPQEWCAEEPLHWGTGNLPDQDGLYGISAYRTASAWLLVTFGLSELFGKVSDDPEVSGWGYELTLLVPRVTGEEQPPAWTLKLLDLLGRQTFSTGRPYGNGHRANTGTSITGDASDGLTAITFVTDPIVAAPQSPFGSVEMLRVVGITADDMAAMAATSSQHVLETAIRVRNPHLATPVSRG